MITNFHDASRGLTARCFKIFPLSPGKKIPLRGTHGYKDATRDDAIIEDCFRTWPNANIAIACGRLSDIIVIDVDVQCGKAGSSSPLRLWSQGKRFPRTLTARTPTGGLHLYYRWLAGVSNSVEKIAPGIDVRADGRHVVASPSVVEGRAYTWVIEAPITDLPSWLQSDLTVDPVPAGDTMCLYRDADLARWMSSKRKEEHERERTWAAKKYLATSE